MIQVRIMSNTVRKTIVVDENTKISTVLSANNVNYDRTPIYLDGAPIKNELEKTFAEKGVTEKCVLSAVVKTENA